MKLIYPKRRLDAEELYNLWRKHHLLPMHLGDEKLIQVVKATAAASMFVLVVEEPNDTVLATALTFEIEPGVLLFQWIPEVRGLHERREDLRPLAKDFQDLWFGTRGIRRVESRVPTARRQTIKTLDQFGFTLETRSEGTRKIVNYGRGWENIAILGLLDTDPRVILEVAQELVEVGNDQAR
jgi:hypothetical protein